MFKYVVLLTSVAIAGVAALFSVTGLSKLFAGAFIPVIIMASTLEIGKLVTASLLTRSWQKLTTVFRAYYIFAVFVLVVITSAGIYGFLTSAYQTTADELRIIERQEQVLESRRARYEEQLESSGPLLESVNQSITQLTQGLASGTRIEYVDSATGQLVSTTSRYTREALQEQLAVANEEREEIVSNRQEWNDSITSIDMQIIDLQANSEVAAEIGPLRYISNLTGVEMDRVVNWFALLIIFVFDPLAVTLVVAYNRLDVEGKRDDDDDPTPPLEPTPPEPEPEPEDDVEVVPPPDHNLAMKSIEESAETTKNIMEDRKREEDIEEGGLDKSPQKVLNLEENKETEESPQQSGNIEKLDHWSALSRNKRL